MPLPLPNLDTRRWTDLVEEGRALIPRYAPTWTDHNVHDPGITLIELLAWLVEQAIYRVNRIPDRHRRKFLALIGFDPKPPRAAVTVLSFRSAPGAESVHLPTGTLFETVDAQGRLLPFRTLEDLRVVPAKLSTVQVDDGSLVCEQTRFWHEGRPIPAFGLEARALGRSHIVAAGDTASSIAQRNEATVEAVVAMNRLSRADVALRPGRRLVLPSNTALYLGFDQSLPAGKAVSIWLRFEGPGTGPEDRERLLREMAERAKVCWPVRPRVTCDPAEPTLDPWCEHSGQSSTPEGPGPESAHSRLVHHSVRTVWEFYADEAGGRWRPLDPEAGEIQDDTRALTLDGGVWVALPVPMKQRMLGDVTEERCYLRCRLERGQCDAAPLLLDAVLNAVAAEQAMPVWHTFPIAAGVTPTGPPPARGGKSPLRMTLDIHGVIEALSFEPDMTELPALEVLDYQAPTLDAKGSLTLALVLLGQSDGYPLQRFTLRQAPVQGDTLRLWTLEGETWRTWEQRGNLDASHRTDPHFALDATTGEIAFGDGERGRIPRQGIPILVAYRSTSGHAGNVAAGRWNLADNVHNRAILGDFEPARDAVDKIANLLPAGGGANVETLEHAAGRAVEALWAHERLVDLCPRTDCATLDQLERSVVLSRRAPERATTLLDYERLALDIPGTRVIRARAWAGLDPTYPCLSAPGTVTVVILPKLPRVRPQPSPGLLRAVRQYLDRRRVIGTRLVVVGPKYLEVSVQAKIRAKAGASPERVREAVIVALNDFLHPLQGGPDRRGWPFGRDVYRSEILQTVDEVPGVDHVLALQLIPGEGDAQCGNLCVGPTWLVTPGQHVIEIV